MLKEIKTKTYHYFVDEDNRIQGEYKDYHENGQLWVHSFYINGNRHGEYKSFYGNGRKFEHIFFQNGNIHGEYKAYHDNGIILRETFFYQGKDLNVDPDTLTEKDKIYIMMSGRLPPREQ
jgi:antitoxin component YwqK of YwqJK toxin-antitoxin module